MRKYLSSEPLILDILEELWSEVHLPHQSGGLFFHKPRTSRTGHNVRDMSIDTFSRNLLVLITV